MLSLPGEEGERDEKKFYKKIFKWLSLSSPFPVFSFFPPPSLPSMRERSGKKLLFKINKSKEKPKGKLSKDIYIYISLLSLPGEEDERYAKKFKNFFSAAAVAKLVPSLA